MDPPPPISIPCLYLCLVYLCVIRTGLHPVHTPRQAVALKFCVVLCLPPSTSGRRERSDEDCSVFGSKAAGWTQGNITTAVIETNR